MTNQLAELWGQDFHAVDPASLQDWESWQPRVTEGAEIIVPGDENTPPGVYRVLSIGWSESVTSFTYVLQDRAGKLHAWLDVGLIFRRAFVSKSASDVAKIQENT